VIHVYAFAERLQDVPAVGGLDGATILRLRVEDVDAVFSRRVAASSRETLRTDAVAHGAVVEALTTRAAAVAPVRFGALLPDEAALADSLRDRLPAIRRAFDRVRDCVEVAVRVLDGVAPVDEAATNGADYLRRRSAAESRWRALVDELHRPLGALSRDARVDRERGTAAYLVAADRLDDVRQAVDRFAARHGELTVVCTGPWAPFSFVEEPA
jgi:Gas vesicle synthesis protein GvpL/GvpF